MSIEAGARAGLFAPDEATYEYLDGRPRSPKGKEWDRALKVWKGWQTDTDASFDKEVDIDVSTLTPMITYGTNPGMVMSIESTIPDHKGNQSLKKALDYMRGTSLPHGTPGFCHVAHKRCGHVVHSTDRHGRRALPDQLIGGRVLGAALDTNTVHGMSRSVFPAQARTRSIGDGDGV